MPRPRPIDSRIQRFASGPASVRNAVSVIVLATAAVVAGSAAMIRFLDPNEYPDIGRGLWWSTQTVTTVGYGDVTPKHLSGRLVGVVVMLWGTAYLAILTATITSTFVARAERFRAREFEAMELSIEKQMETRLNDLDSRLDRIEQSLSRLAGD
ncbi:MAG TPA: ion channel [Gaiellaceae bacterium]